MNLEQRVKRLEIENKIVMTCLNLNQIALKLMGGKNKETKEELLQEYEKTTQLSLKYKQELDEFHKEVQE